MAQYNVSYATSKNAVDTLVGSEPLIYARRCRIKCTGKNMRPMTYVNVFVEDERYNARVEGRDWSITGTSNSTYLKPGQKFRTNSSGDVDFFLDLEGGRFKTGDIKITVSDGDTPYSGTTTLESIFHSEGTLQVYRRFTSELNITRISQPWDPVGQGFFTFGTGSPVCISSIDLYFASKDATIPVQLQIRKMVAGYPDINFVSPEAVVDMDAANIKTTGDEDNFSTPTTFKFKVPIVLEPDQQYCFVVQSNSNAYNMYTASMGQESFETKKIIFEQPYIGTMFKSQNNFTWVVAPNETLKFTIKKAVFDTSTPAKIFLGGNTGSRMVPGSQFTTKQGSRLVIFRSNEQHGYGFEDNPFIANQKITIRANAPELSADSPLDDAAFGGYGDFNGLTLGQISGDWTITRIIDNYTVEFEAGGVATQSGPITSSGMVSFVQIEGIALDSPAPTAIVFPTPIGGEAATYTPHPLVDGESFTGVNLTLPGRGYKNNFELEVNGSDSTVGYIQGITGAGGIPPKVTCVTTASFVVDMLKPVSLFTTNLLHLIPDGASIDMKHRFTLPGGSQSQSFNTDLYGPNYAPEGALIANNVTSMGLNQDKRSFQIEVDLRSTNKNVGAMFNFGSGASISTFSNVINAQGFLEDTTATEWTSNIDLANIEITDAGSGYAGVPPITVTPAEDETNVANITPLMLTAVVDGNGAVSGVVVTQVGVGYTRPPTIEVAQPGSTFLRASIRANMNPHNSELAPLNGTALSRYITKEIKLAMPSNGIKLRSKIVSTPDTSVDWYIKTSLGSAVESNLDEQPWQILSCASRRDKSIKPSDVYEYEFTRDDMVDFTSYKLKAVLSSKKRNLTPYIRDYKVTLTA